MKKKSQLGFTLVELIVAVFVFSAVSVVAGGIFISAIELNRRSLNIQRADENIRSVFEILSREIRVANSITTSDTNCPLNPTNTLSLVHPVNGNVNYFVSNSQVHRTVNGSDSIISSNDVKIIALNFCIKGTPRDDKLQPRILISMAVEAGGGNQKVTNQVQTTLSKRRLTNDDD